MVYSVVLSFRSKLVVGKITGQFFCCNLISFQITVELAYAICVNVLR